MTMTVLYWVGEAHRLARRQAKAQYGGALPSLLVCV